MSISPLTGLTRAMLTLAPVALSLTNLVSPLLLLGTCALGRTRLSKGSATCLQVGGALVVVDLIHKLSLGAAITKWGTKVDAAFALSGAIFLAWPMGAKKKEETKGEVKEPGEEVTESKEEITESKEEKKETETQFKETKKEVEEECELTAMTVKYDKKMFDKNNKNIMRVEELTINFTKKFVSSLCVSIMDRLVESEKLKTVNFHVNSRLKFSLCRLGINKLGLDKYEVTVVDSAWLGFFVNEERVTGLVISSNITAGEQTAAPALQNVEQFKKITKNWQHLESLSLDLFNVQMPKVLIDVLRELNKLRSLSISGCNYFLKIAENKNMTNTLNKLDCLVVREGKVDNLKFLKNCSKLKVLSIDLSNITQDPSQDFGKLKALESCELTNLPGKFISALQCVSQSVTSVSITGSLPEDLSLGGQNYDKLTELAFSQSQFTQAQFESMLVRMPKVEHVFCDSLEMCSNIKGKFKKVTLMLQDPRHFEKRVWNQGLKVDRLYILASKPSMKIALEATEPWVPESHIDLIAFDDTFTIAETTKTQLAFAFPGVKILYDQSQLGMIARNTAGLPHASLL